MRVLRPLSIFLLFVWAVTVHAKTRTFSIFHTNDWHSRFLGFGPNSEYSPDTANDDDTVGGVARRAALLYKRREIMATKGPVLTLDGGDFMMGSLFHTLNGDEAFELRLMAQMGYDAITLGNHDFEWGPKGLAKMVRRALKEGPIPAIVAANTVLSEKEPGDDDVAILYKNGHISPHIILEREGLRFGIFGLIGAHAVEVTKTAAPLTFIAAKVAAAQQVKLLKKKRVDVIIALSHSGVWQKQGVWAFEDVELAKSVAGIDIIVSGHSHQVVKKPIIVGKTVIVQAGSLGAYLGELTVTHQEGGPVKVQNYELHEINDTILGEQSIMDEVAQMGAIIEQRILKPKGFTFDQPIVETDRGLTRAYNDHLLANLVTDAIRIAAKSDFSFTGNGTIRSELVKGRTGVQSVADIFRVAPLGKGHYESVPGYPLIKAYVTGPEVKSIVEVFLLAYQKKGPPYFPRVSGIRIFYNPYRVLFDKVFKIEMGDESKGWKAIDLSGGDGKKYSFACTTYVGKFVWAMKKLSFGILTATPTFADGKPIPSPIEAIVDGSKIHSGVQEIKEWQALINLLRSLPDTDGDGVANIPPPSDSRTKCRIIKNASLQPSLLLGNATWLMWTVVAVIICMQLVVIIVIIRIKRRRKSE